MKKKQKLIIINNTEVMKFSIIILSVLIFGVCICNAQKKMKPKTPKKIIPKLVCGDDTLKFTRVFNWYNIDTFSNYNYKLAQSISKVKKLYGIKNGLLTYKNKIIKSIEIFYKLTDSIEYIVWIRKGLPIKILENVEGHPRPTQFYILYNKNTISFHSPENTSYIKNGNGVLKKFYYGKWIFTSNPQTYEKGPLKEDGEVKNNFKFGEWKYYSKEGEINSIKTYTLKDSVDVRFPHCIFNKKEPCY